MDTFTRRVAEIAVAIAVIGPAAVLGMFLGAAAHLLWPSTLLAADESFGVLAAVGLAGWWYAKLGRHWIRGGEA